MIYNAEREGNVKFSSSSFCHNFEGPKINYVRDNLWKIAIIIIWVILYLKENRITKNNMNIIIVKPLWMWAITLLEFSSRRQFGKGPSRFTLETLTQNFNKSKLEYNFLFRLNSYLIISRCNVIITSSRKRLTR